MLVFNWIQTDFGDRPNFVSDAPEDLARAIAQRLSSLPDNSGICEFGILRLDSTTGSHCCSYLRYVPPATPSSLYMHAVIVTSDLGDPTLESTEPTLASAEPTLSSTEAFFRARYGNPPEARLQQLVAQTAQMPVAQATLALTDLFVRESDLSVGQAAAKAIRRPKRLTRPANATLPWLLATAGAAFAGFTFGAAPTPSLAPVGAPPPNFDLPIAAEPPGRLGDDQGAAGVSLRGQLEYERKEHRRILEEKDLELTMIAARLDSLRLPTPNSASPGGPSDSDSESESKSMLVPESASETLERVPDSPLPVARAEQRAVVYADRLWVREGPDLKYLRIHALDDGDTVKLTGREKPGWVEISAPTEGWVASEFLDFIATEGEVVAIAPAVESREAAIPDEDGDSGIRSDSLSGGPSGISWDISSDISSGDPSDIPQDEPQPDPSIRIQTDESVADRHLSE